MVFRNLQVVLGVARGGMANVWLAQQRGARGFRKLVALKTILPELAGDLGFERMFLEEARLAGLVHHPNVCEIFELEEFNGLLALTMEWVDGESLARMLAAKPEPLEARVAARIIACAAAGLQAAHELNDDAGLPLGIVHRDISPQNILIAKNGHVKISDFGIAKALGRQCDSTDVGHVKGKLAYMSPEQARGDRLDARSDIFSLGVVLYQATLGRFPFGLRDELSAVKLYRLLECDAPRPLALAPCYPRGLAAIVERAMRKEPGERFQTAGAMREALESWLSSSGKPVTELDVARALGARCDAPIKKREANIRACIGSMSDISIAQPLVSSSEPSKLSETGRASPRAIARASRFALANLAHARVVPIVVAFCGLLALTGQLAFGAFRSSGPRMLHQAIDQGAANAPAPAPVFTELPRLTDVKGSAPAPSRPEPVEPSALVRPPPKSVTGPTASAPARSGTVTPKARPTRAQRPLGPTERDL